MQVPLEESVRLYERAGEPKTKVVLDGAAHHAVYEPTARWPPSCRGCCVTRSA
jgi:hypothetical protein